MYTTFIFLIYLVILWINPDTYEEFRFKKFYVSILIFYGIDILRKAFLIRNILIGNYTYINLK